MKTTPTPPCQCGASTHTCCECKTTRCATQIFTCHGCNARYACRSGDCADDHVRDHHPGMAVGHYESGNSKDHVGYDDGSGGDKVPQDKFPITLNRYQRDNLLWLLSLCNVWPLTAADTGDWLGEIRWLLDPDGNTLIRPNITRAAFIETLNHMLAIR